MRTGKRAALIACGAALQVAALQIVASPARASDIGKDAPLAPARPWALQVTPYLWASGLSGDLSPFRRAPTVGVDKSFSDVLNDLNFGGFVNLWARYDRFVLSGDVMYVHTTDGRTSGPLPIVGPVTGTLSSKEFTASLQAGYRIFEAPLLTLDLLGGFRTWRISNTVSASAGPLAVSYGESFGWTDPVIGTRVFWRLTDRLSLMGQADVGGFGVGSRQTWQILGTANYILSDHWSVSAGYKVLKVDYDSGGHVFNTTLHGPVFGVTYRF